MCNIEEVKFITVDENNSQMLINSDDLFKGLNKNME